MGIHYLSVSGMQIAARMAGAVQTLDRNKVRRIILTEREPAE